MKRFALVATLAALFMGGSAAPSSAASFDDSRPCPADGPLLVCPTAQVGQPYSLQLRALYGCDTYRWEIAKGGALPEGLTLSSSGLVSGTPKSSGRVQPYVVVHDLTAAEGGPPWCGGDNKSERQFVFNVVPGLSIQNQSVPGGTIGQPYSVKLTAVKVTNLSQSSGSPANATWRIQSGSLPAGVTLASDGSLSGTPTAEGSYTFVVRAEADGAVDTETETLVVRQPIAVSSPFTAGAAPKAEVGVPFSAAQTATGGAGTFTWSVSEGALPAGLVLNPDGTLSGTPAVPGRFTFVVSVSDKEARTTKLTATLVVASKLAIRTLRLKAAKVGKAYRFKVATLGGVAPTTWTVRGKLAQGIKFDKRTGTFAGVPRKAGKYRVTVQAVDSFGVTAQRTLTLVVRA